MKKRNMGGMYENVKSDRRMGKDTRMWIIVGTILGVCVIVAASVIWFLGYHGRFTEFVGKLSASTTYALKNDGLIAKVDGKTFLVSEENMYGIYAYLSLNKSGRESRKIPDGEPVVLDYGNGTMLKLWDMPDKANKGRHNLFIQYTDIKGDIYSYISYKTTLDTVVVRYLTYGNELVSS